MSLFSLLRSSAGHRRRRRGHGRDQHRIARRSATAGDITAIATKTATEVAQKQLAIERDRHRQELEQRHVDAAPALAGHVVKNDGNDAATGTPGWRSVSRTRYGSLR